MQATEARKFHWSLLASVVQDIIWTRIFTKNCRIIKISEKFYHNFTKKKTHYEIFSKIDEILPKVKCFTKSGCTDSSWPDKEYEGILIENFIWQILHWRLPYYIYDSVLIVSSETLLVMAMYQWKYVTSRDNIYFSLLTLCWLSTKY